jgi:cyclophilin family peptidyl-prolyl cis-trans isomerase
VLRWKCIYRFGCPHARDPKSRAAGTGGPAPGSQFVNLATGKTVTRNVDGGIPDELLPTAKFSNEVGTLSMANTGEPETGGSQVR